MAKDRYIRVFSSIKEAEDAQDDYYATLPIDKKLQEFLMLLNTYREDNKIAHVVFKYALGQSPTDMAQGEE